MIGIGIIGAGVMGRQHALSAVRHADARLVGIAATAFEQAEELADQHSVRATRTLDELLEPGDIDAVIVATPTDTHADVAVEAMRRGVHVLVEKPIARRMEDALHMAAVARECDRVLAVGHVIRYFPEYRALHRSITSGELGDVAVATFGRRCQQPDWAPDAWHTSMQRSGGVVLDMMIHDIDLVRWYFGEPDRVYARALGSDSHDGLDYAVATLHVPGGPICHLNGSWAEPDGFSQWAEVCGTHGMLTYDSRGREEMLIARHGGSADAATALPPPPPDERDPFLMQQADWLGQIRGEGTLINTPEWAIASMQIALALLESSERRQPIQLHNNIEVTA